MCNPTDNERFAAEIKQIRNEQQNLEEDEKKGYFIL